MTADELERIRERLQRAPWCELASDAVTLLAAYDEAEKGRAAAELAVETWVATECEALTRRLEAANACVDIFRKRVAELTAERELEALVREWREVADE